MNIVVEARHMEVTDSIRDYVESKVSKLPKYYDHIHSIETILDMEAERPVVEIIVTATRKHTFVATHRAADMEDLYACVDNCFDKIAEQLRRFKGKVRDHKNSENPKRQ